MRDVRTKVVVGATLLLLIFVAALSLVIRAANSDPIADARARVLQSKHGISSATELIDNTIHARGPSRREMELALLIRKDEVLPALQSKLRSAPPSERYELLMLVQGELRWEELQQSVMETLQDQSLPERVRGRAATALAQFQHREAIPHIRRLLEVAQEDQTRQWAVLSLGALRDSQSQEVMVDMLDEVSPYLQADAAMALGMLGDDAGLEAALELSHSDFFGVRCRASEALSYIGTTTALERLHEMKENDPSSTVRSESAQYIGRAALDALGDDDAVNRLKEMLFPAGPGTPRWAFLYLVDHFPSDAAPVLHQLAGASGPLQTAAIMALMQIDSAVAARPRLGRSSM